MWGESYARADYLRRLADSLRFITDDFPPDDFFRTDLTPGMLAHGWIANLYPPLEKLHSAHRAFFEELFWTAARSAGYERWGLKTVHLGGDYARYLSFLFPDGDFIVLMRDPFATYLSYRRWLEWYDRYPDSPVFTARRFGRMWRRRTHTLLETSGEIGALVVRYEDLVGVDGEDTLDRISEHLGASVDHSALKVRVPARGKPRPKRTRLPKLERLLLEREVGELASSLGYEPPNW